MPRPKKAPELNVEQLDAAQADADALSAELGTDDAAAAAAEAAHRAAIAAAFPEVAADALTAAVIDAEAEFEPGEGDEPDQEEESRDQRIQRIRAEAMQDAGEAMKGMASVLSSISGPTDVAKAKLQFWHQRRLALLDRKERIADDLRRALWNLQGQMLLATISSNNYQWRDNAQRPTMHAAVATLMGEAAAPWRDTAKEASAKIGQQLLFAEDMIAALETEITGKPPTLPESEPGE